jgi:hypothetical protein
MAERETVIRGLEVCYSSGLLCPQKKCPYNGYALTCKYVLMRDTLALLKEQEPRVMTLEEVRNLKYDDVVYYQGINTNSVESAIVLHGEKMVPEVNTRVVQFRHADGTGGWNGINNADLNWYGKKWRCWTSRPTEEQMRDTPWEADNETM